jgi:hypothetical protein
MSHIRPGLTAHREYVLPPPNAAIAVERAALVWASHRASTSDASVGRSAVVRSLDPDPDAMIPGFPSSSLGSYVIIAKTGGPHGSLRTAQALPDLPYFGVVGTVGHGDPVDFYRVTLSTAATRLDFGLVSPESGPVVPVQVDLFNGAGALLGEWTTGGPGAQTLHLPLGPQTAGATFYVGISAAGGGGQTIDYQLWVSHQSTANPPAIFTSEATTSPTSALAPLPPVTFASPATVGTPAAGADSQAATAPANPVAGLGSAVGPAVIRSASPSGGVLSDGDAAPSGERELAAIAHQESGERPLARQEPKVRERVESLAQARPANEASDFVVLAEQGGFPLLGAVAFGHRPHNAAPATGGADSHLVTEGGASQITSPALAANGEVAATEKVGSNQPGPRRIHPWGGVRMSLFSGLGLATVWTLNTVLSQPMAGFDYLASKLDRARPGRRSFRRKGHASPKTSVAGNERGLDSRAQSRT